PTPPAAGPAPVPAPAPDGGLTDLPRLLAAADGWEPLRAAVAAGQSGGVDGAWGSSGAAAVVAVAAEVPGPGLGVVPGPADLAARGRRLSAGQAIDTDELIGWLSENGYKRVEAVEFPGEFGRRGGIVDLYPPDLPDPVRLEFFGDELESIRTFSAGTQRS